MPASRTRRPGHFLLWCRRLGLIALMATSHCAWSLDLQTVLDNTIVTPPARVAFREELHNPMLKEPMVLEGYLEYLGTGRLRKVVESPFEESFLIESNQIVIERSGDSRKLSLNKSKSLKTILGAIEAILAGQADKLMTVFSHQLSGTDSAWSVELTPISRRMSKQLISLQVDGDDQSATSIRVNLKDGEWHLMKILRNDLEP